MHPLVHHRARTLQWLAALVAVCYHLRFLLFADYAHLANRGLPARAFYFFTSLGHEAFVVYMTVAGALFGSAAWSRWQREGKAAIDGLALRLRALYWWLVPAMLVGGLLDAAGSRWLAGSGVYAAAPQFHEAHLNLRTLAGNLLLLQNVAVQGYGSNAMLFLLTYEWWACAGAALAALAIARSRMLALAAGSAAGLAMSWTGLGYFGYWIAWLAGLGAAVAGQRKQRSPIGVAAAAALFVATLFGSRILGARLALLPPQLLPASRSALDLLVALGAGVYLLALHCAPRKAPQHGVPHARLARMSPAVFALHFPVMLFLVAASVQLLGLPLAAQPGPGGVCAFVLLAAAIWWCAWCFAAALARLKMLLRGAARAGPAACAETSAAAKVK